MDVRAKTFVAEVCGRLGYVLENLGFAGPEVIGEPLEFPLVLEVRYHRSDVAIGTRLILAYGGEESVDTSLLVEGETDRTRRVEVGSDSAHTGYQMCRALDRHAQAVLRVFEDGLRDGRI